ncbi:hypothetical protein Tco_1244072 [Tanacetum coccineum]
MKTVWVIRGCHPNREGKVADIDADAERTGNVVEKEVLHTTTIDELTLGQTLIKISSCKPKLDDKGKAKMTKLEMPLKKKDQIIYDQEVALNLQAQLQTKLEEEERLLQAREQEELTDEEKARLFLVKGSEKRAEDSSKRAGTKLEQEVAKKQKIDDAKVDDDQEEARMKELMNIVPDEEEVAIDAIPYPLSLQEHY